MRAFLRPGVALALILGTAACGSTGSSTPGPASPEATVSGFLDAVRAENLQTMGELFGSSRGPSRSYMSRSELEQRLTVIRTILVHEAFTIVPDNETTLRPAPGEHIVRVRLARGACRPVVPFTLVRYRAGWLVKEIDLEAAGNPRRPCPERR